MSARPRILIVDDEEMILRSLTRLLVRAGHDVVTRASLADARAALATERVDVVVTDLRVGAASGLELIASARAMVPAPPVIVFSGLATPDDVAAALAAGAAAVVAKPVVPAELVAAIAAALRG
jgi:two-component system response regulator PilR (NtrC family)